MTPITNDNSFSSSNVNNVQAPQKIDNEKKESIAVVSEQSKESPLTDDGRKLLSTLAEIDESKKADEDNAKKSEDMDVGEKVESFAYGALGIDHPDDIKETTDDSYSAGQYLKGALSIGALLLAIV